MEATSQNLFNLYGTCKKYHEFSYLKYANEYSDSKPRNEYSYSI